MELLNQILGNTSAGPSYESDDDDICIPSDLPVRIIAYYLPQFHPIPENDRWWGKGFTEWTNVTKAVPRYVGQYQPRLPGELGFYDLRLTDNIRRQAELARRHGIAGFCFHYYWFGGKQLLERPLNELLSNPDIDLPFCINWANEKWTRTWGGPEKGVLMEQTFSPGDDLALARAIEPLIRDPRYIKIDGRPIVLVYRPALLPDARGTVARWREYFRSKGLSEPYLVMPQAFGKNDPRDFGMDAAAGFPPHKFGWHLPSLTNSLELLDPNFRGRVFSYEAMAQSAMALQSTEYTLFHGVCPDWDNEARRPGCGSSFAGSTPKIYGQWLANACEKARLNTNPQKRIVFVNAWNEWAEGAYLEPDRHRGYAFLRETARVLATRNLTNENHLSPKPSTNGTLPVRVLPRLIRTVRQKAANTVDRLTDAIRPD